MKLIRARVTNYKSIDDSGWVPIDDVTCLVGKNESGKTCFLQALRKLNPAYGIGSNFDLMDYPRKGYVRYKKVHKESPAVAVTAEFELSERELHEVEADLGQGVLASPIVAVSKDYANVRRWEVNLDERAVVRHVLAGAGLPVEVHEHAEKAETCQELIERLQALEVKPSSVQRLLSHLSERFQTSLRQQVECYLDKFMPRFVYFDDYSTMRGRISIQDLRRRWENKQELSDSDRTFLSLLSLVGADLEDLENELNYEHIKAELESASIGISDEIFKFWNQNKQLRVEFDLSNANPKDPPPLNEGTILHVRIWNNRHRVSVPFDERSKGFVWFFSFLVYFSQLEGDESTDLVLLLDEPGLSLHAMAQNDFLRFIDDRLAPKHQVIYTTHSPFMINLAHLDRVRTVQDVEDRGTVISDDVLRNDQDTIYPLQVALGYKLAQTLFLAPHCILVNSASDLVYLKVLGDAAVARGRMGLDPRWVVIPVGGADNLPTYISLLGENYVNVAVLMDVTPKARKRIDALNQTILGRRRNPIKLIEVTRVRDADVEDLFEPGFYLKLVNEAYAAELHRELTLKAITDSNPRIARRVEAHFQKEGIAGGRFDPYRPAVYLLQNQAALLPEIDDATIDRAASMFERINALLPTNGHVSSINGNGSALKTLAATS